MRLLLFLVAFFSASVFADAYTYTGQYLSSDAYFSSPQDACSAIFDWRQAEMPGSYSYSDQHLEGNWSRDADTCLGSRHLVSTGQIVATNVVLGYVYRSMCTAGIQDTIEWPFGVKDPITGEVSPADAILPPWPVCMTGCMYQKKSPAVSPECHTYPDEDQSKVFCAWAATRNGDACSTSDEPEKPELPDCPSGYTSSASGCVPDTPPDPCEADPSASGCDDGGDPGDGGTDPCETDPSASGCDDGGDPGDGGTDPGDGGDGGDDGDGGDGGDGDGDGDGSAGGFMNCDAPLACEGDPIACAQLQVQKQIMCDAPDTNYPGQKGAIEDFLDDPKFQEEEGEEVNVSDLVKEGSRFLPSSCPAPLRASLSNGRSITIAYDPICQIADSLSYLFVALAWVFFAVYIGRSSGGD